MKAWLTSLRILDKLLENELNLGDAIRVNNPAQKRLVRLFNCGNTLTDEELEILENAVNEEIKHYGV